MFFHAVLVPIEYRPCISYIYILPDVIHIYVYIYIYTSSSQHLQQTKASSPHWEYVLLFTYFLQWIILVLVKGDRDYITPQKTIYTVLYLVYKRYILPRWVIIYYLPAFTRTKIIHCFFLSRLGDAESVWGSQLEVHDDTFRRRVWDPFFIGSKLMLR